MGNLRQSMTDEEWDEACIQAGVRQKKVGWPLIQEEPKKSSVALGS